MLRRPIEPPTLTPLDRVAIHFQEIVAFLEMVADRENWGDAYYTDMNVEEYIMWDNEFTPDLREAAITLIHKLRIK